MDRDLGIWVWSEKVLWDCRCGMVQIDVKAAHYHSERYL